MNNADEILQRMFNSTRPAIQLPKAKQQLKAALLSKKRTVQIGKEGVVGSIIEAVPVEAIEAFFKEG